jgi:hypothetical protein
MSLNDVDPDIIRIARIAFSGELRKPWSQKARGKLDLLKRVFIEDAMSTGPQQRKLGSAARKLVEVEYFWL